MNFRSAHPTGLLTRTRNGDQKARGSVLETILDVSPATVKHDWQIAKTWLFNELRHGDADVAKCLRKDRTRRLHDIADARIEIEDVLAAAPGTGGNESGDRAPSRSVRWRTLLTACVAAAAIAAILAGVLVRSFFPSPSQVMSPRRVSVNLPRAIPS